MSNEAPDEAVQSWEAPAVLAQLHDLRRFCSLRRWGLLVLMVALMGQLGPSHVQVGHRRRPSFLNEAGSSLPRCFLRSLGEDPPLPLPSTSSTPPDSIWAIPPGNGTHIGAAKNRGRFIFNFHGVRDQFMVSLGMISWEFRKSLP